PTRERSSALAGGEQLDRVGHVWRVSEVPLHPRELSPNPRPLGRGDLPPCEHEEVDVTLRRVGAGGDRAVHERGGDELAANLGAEATDRRHDVLLHPPALHPAGPRARASSPLDPARLAPRSASIAGTSS